MGCHFLLQGIFPTQGLNPGLPHCRQILYQLSQKGRIKRKQKNSGRISYRPQILCWLGGIKCSMKTVLWVWTTWHDWYCSVMVNHLNQWKASERNVVVKRNLDCFLHLFQPLNRWHRGIGVFRSPAHGDCPCWAAAAGHKDRPRSPSLCWPLSTVQHRPTCPPQTWSVLLLPTPKSSQPLKQPWEQAWCCWA